MYLYLSTQHKMADLCEKPLETEEETTESVKAGTAPEQLETHDRDKKGARWGSKFGKPVESVRIEAS